jgi:hypothetical protein
VQGHALFQPLYTPSQDKFIGPDLLQQQVAQVKAQTDALSDAFNPAVLDTFLTQARAPPAPRPHHAAKNAPCSTVHASRCAAR